MTAGEALKQLAAAFIKDDPSLYLLHKPQRETWSVEYAAWRLANAWRQSRQTGDNRFTPDHAVLLRQVARWANGITLPSVPPALAELAQRSGVRFIGNGRVEALPFVPDWLTADGDLVDPVAGIDIPPVVRRLDESMPAEPFLLNLGFDRWQSPAQKEAVWLAMTAPKRSTVLIVLPTGTGKSLCFQAAACISGGLTVVVVPTIALAIDQWRAATHMLPAMAPQYYASDDRSRPPQQVLQELRSGSCRLLFTSPEACVSGRLQAFLNQAATSGVLTNLVIDEAHLVETWGAHFRVDFQFLASLRRKWLASNVANFRTILLSATVSPASRRLLRQLYADSDGPTGDGWREFSSQRLRPEMAYFYRQFSGERSNVQRHAAVLACAWHMPRPAIFYTTEVEEAEKLFAALREEGFKRIGLFTGDTPASERRALLARWRQSDDIDLMVATSAFGLGVDKPDVRSIIHACLPENLNRYYQEVGRGGRDGASFGCVLLPTDRDFEIASNLLPTMLKPETIQARWEAMWTERRPVDPEQEHVWKLTPRTQQIALRGERSGMRNAAWNKRLLLQLLRAQKLELLDVKYEDGTDEEESAEWITVRILDFMPETKKLGQSIISQRDQELNEASAELKQIQAYLSGEECIKRTLRRTYGGETVTVCGGCRYCRQNHLRTETCPPLPVEIEFDRNQIQPQLEVVGNCPSPIGVGRVEFRELVRQSIRIKNTRRFVVDTPLDGDLFQLVRTLIGESVQLVSEIYRLDTLRGNVPFLVHPDEDIAVFHVDRPSERGMELARGRRLTHLFCGSFYAEPSGRHFLLSKGARLFTDWRQWMQVKDGGH